MRKHASHKTRVRVLQTFLSVFAAFTVLFGHYVFVFARAVSAQTPMGSVVVPVEPATKPAGVPTHITISSIAVDAAIESVALAKDGSMGVPKDPMDTGWYEPGPRPGDVGSAVIDGHVNWFNGAKGVFENLRKVKAGDVITVQNDTGEVTRFVVRETRMYAAAEDATAVFFSQDGKAHLNLITCDGAWDKGAKQYTERLVVFADLL